MATLVEISNRALAKLGQPSIMSLDDNSPAARKCAQELPAALNTVLRAYPWPFAIKRMELAQLQEVPPFGSSFYYALPTDVARLVEVRTEGLKYNIESGKIVTNAGSVAIRYVSNNINTEQMDAYATEVLCLKLASQLATILTENVGLKDKLDAEYEVRLSEARGIWAQEDYPVTPEEGSWLAVHEYGGPKDTFISTFNPWGANGDGS